MQTTPLPVVRATATVPLAAILPTTAVPFAVVLPTAHLLPLELRYQRGVASDTDRLTGRCYMGADCIGADRIASPTEDVSRRTLIAGALGALALPIASPALLVPSPAPARGIAQGLQPDD